MNALIQHRSLRQRLSWWLALQSFAGLGLVCLAVYLVTEFNFRDRQEDTLAQKENVIRHLLADSKEHKNSEDLAHKLDDFLVGHGDLSLELAQADGFVLYAHARNQNAKTVWRQRQFEVAQTAGQPPSKVLRVRLSLDIQTDNQLLHRLALTLLVAAIGGPSWFRWVASPWSTWAWRPFEDWSARRVRCRRTTCTTGSTVQSNPLNSCP